MARRVSWTNNSSGHSGTYVYRDETLDPQNLPAPVATVDPVVQGATAEWVDDSGEYGCFAVQDFDGQGVGSLSAEVCVTDPWASVQIGDEIEGGYFAGIMLDESDNEYALIVSQKAQGDPGLTTWQQGIDFCTSLSIDGYDDWSMPTIDELIVLFWGFKPTTELNTNLYSNDLGRYQGETDRTDPPKPPYERSVPSQTSLVDFQEGGGEAFVDRYFAITEEEGSNDRMFILDFDYGAALTNLKTNPHGVRAVRRVPV